MVMLLRTDTPDFESKSVNRFASSDLRFLTNQMHFPPELLEPHKNTPVNVFTV